MDRKLLVLCSTFAVSSVLAQAPPTIEWQRALGGTSFENGVSTHQSVDGGYVVAGQTLSNDGDVEGNHGGSDCWMVKLAPNGTLQWQRTLGGSADDWAACTQQTGDGGYVMAGATSSNDGDVTGAHGGKDFWVVKLNGLGALSWQVALGGSGWDEATSIQQTEDGGYIVAGKTSSANGQVTGAHGWVDAWVVKLNASGVFQWQKTLGGSLVDELYAIQQTNDGGYIACGTTNSNDGDVAGNHGNYDYWVLKLDGIGSLLWQKTFGGSENDTGVRALQTDDGGYVVTGNTSSMDGDLSNAPGNGDMWVLELDGTGELQWERALGGSGIDGGYSISITDAQEYVMAGYSDSNDGDASCNHGLFDYWITQVDGTGTVQWELCLGGGDADEPHWIQAIGSGGYIIAGTTRSNDGDVSGNNGSDDLWVVKLHPYVDGMAALDAPVFSISPNPGHGPIRITTDRFIDDGDLLLTDAAGRLLLEERITGQTRTLDLEQFAPGCYALCLRTGTAVHTVHLVLE